MDRAARLLALYDQRVATATAQAAAERRRESDATASAAAMRRVVAQGMATLGLAVETDLDREALHARLRTLGVRRAHFAEVTLEAGAQQDAARLAAERQAQCVARAAVARRKARKLKTWQDRVRLRRHLVDAATQSMDIEETFACRHP